MNAESISCPQCNSELKLKKMPMSGYPVYPCLKCEKIWKYDSQKEQYISIGQIEKAK